MDYKDLAIELLKHMEKNPKLPLDEPRDDSRGEMGLLIYLNFIEDGVTSGKLSEFLKVSTGRVASALKNLEKKGLIERRNDELDRRRVNVYITDAGKELVIEKHNKGLVEIEKILQKLSIDDAKEFVRLIKLIIN